MNEITQGSEEWHQLRLGRATGSRFSDVLAKGQGISRRKYLRQLVTERLTGQPTETYKNAQMDRGNEQEPFARMAYEARTGNVVQEVAFIPHATLMAGVSPDGIIDLDGGVEIKSVIPTVQLDTILDGTYPSEHKAQIQGSLWITGRSYWHFVSFCPLMPEHLRLYIFKVERDELYIANLAAEVKTFLSEVDALVARMKEIK